VSRISQHFPKVGAVVLCGIAGGAPIPGDAERGIFLGDLVLANQVGVHQYDFGRARLPKGRVKKGQLLEASQDAIAPDDMFTGIAHTLLAMDMKNERPWNDRLNSRLPELMKRDNRFARPESGAGASSYERIMDKKGRTETIELASALDRP